MQFLRSFFMALLALILLPSAAYYLLVNAADTRQHATIAQYILQTRCGDFTNQLNGSDPVQRRTAYLSATAKVEQNPFFILLNPQFTNAEVTLSELNAACTSNPRQTVYEAFESVDLEKIGTEIDSALNAAALATEIKISVTSATTPSPTSEISAEAIEPSAGAKEKGAK